jgi:hypothetical protein
LSQVQASLWATAASRYIAPRYGLRFTAPLSGRQSTGRPEVKAWIQAFATANRQAVSGGSSRYALTLADLAAIPLQRAAHRQLVARCWELRNNLTIYAASYVALAEALDVALLTGDERLAGATGSRCNVEVLSAAP